jgi:hypothetical protein
MLQQPMKEKLYALKLQGMIEALEHQEQDEATRELSFLDRLSISSGTGVRTRLSLDGSSLRAYGEPPASRTSTIVPSED